MTLTRALLLPAMPKAAWSLAVVMHSTARPQSSRVGRAWVQQHIARASALSTIPMPRVLEEPAWRQEHGRATSRKHHRLDFQALGIAEQHVVKRRDARCAGLHGARKMQCVASLNRTCGIEDQRRGADENQPGPAKAISSRWRPSGRTVPRQHGPGRRSSDEFAA